MCLTLHLVHGLITQKVEGAWLCGHTWRTPVPGTTSVPSALWLLGVPFPLYSFYIHPSHRWVSRAHAALASWSTSTQDYWLNGLSMKSVNVEYNLQKLKCPDRLVRMQVWTNLSKNKAGQEMSYVWSLDGGGVVGSGQWKAPWFLNKGFCAHRSQRKLGMVIMLESLLNGGSACFPPRRLWGDIVNDLLTRAIHIGSPNSSTVFIPDSPSLDFIFSSQSIEPILREDVLRIL